MVYATYVTSMFLYIVRSRCMRVGQDIGRLFEPVYMKMVADRIISLIDLSMPNPEAFYVNRERIVTFGLMELKMLFNKESFKALQAGKPIEEDKATAWIKQNVVGRITKANLDKEKLSEMTELDMMQNQSIIYHTESIIEMQIGLLLFCYALNQLWEEPFKYGVLREGAENASPFGMSFYDFSNILCFLMLAEHFMSYLFTYIKNNDIYRRGVSNEIGIENTTMATVLDCVSVLFEFVIFLLTIVHVVTMGEKVHDIPLINYFLVLNICVTMLTIPYGYISRR